MLLGSLTRPVDNVVRVYYVYKLTFNNFNALLKYHVGIIFVAHKINYFNYKSIFNYFKICLITL